MIFDHNNVHEMKLFIVSLKLCLLLVISYCFDRNVIILTLQLILIIIGRRIEDIELYKL